MKDHFRTYIVEPVVAAVMVPAIIVGLVYEYFRTGIRVGRVIALHVIETVFKDPYG